MAVDGIHRDGAVITDLEQDSRNLASSDQMIAGAAVFTLAFAVDGIDLYAPRHEKRPALLKSFYSF
jgi:hypothetical protein